MGVISQLFRKSARRVLRALPASTALPVLSGPNRGMRWVLRSGNNAFWTGSYAPDETTAFLRLIRPGAVVYDLGANVGYYTLAAARRVGPTGQVIAFEPLPRNLALLERHVRLNRLTNVRVLPVAASDRAGVARFDESSSTFQGHLDDRGSITVVTDTIDRLVERGEIPPPTVMKLDVEGAELLVLRGASRTIARYRPTILVEVHSVENDVACPTFLDSLGYTFEALEGGEKPSWVPGPWPVWGEFIARPSEAAPLAVAREPGRATADVVRRPRASAPEASPEQRA